MCLGFVVFYECVVLWYHGECCHVGVSSHGSYSSYVSPKLTPTRLDLVDVVVDVFLCFLGAFMRLSLHDFYKYVLKPETFAQDEADRQLDSSIAGE